MILLLRAPTTGGVTVALESGENSITQISYVVICQGETKILFAKLLSCSKGITSLKVLYKALCRVAVIIQ